MKRFLPLLIPIVCLLVAIPFLLLLKVVVLAKIMGVIMIILTTVAIRFWLHRANKLRTRGERVKFTINERYFLNEHFPLYKRLSSQDRNKLEERVGLMLSEISFDRFDGKDVRKEECIAFSCLLGLAVLGLPYQSSSNKIVVFKEGNDPEIHFQSKHPVLFIDEQQVMDVLFIVKSIELNDTTHIDLKQILQGFYTINDFNEFN